MWPPHLFLPVRESSTATKPNAPSLRLSRYVHCCKFDRSIVSKLEASPDEMRDAVSAIEATANTLAQRLQNLDVTVGNELLIDMALKRNPHHRLTTPADVAGAIIALSHPGADWVTGNVINVDGGEEISA